MIYIIEGPDLSGKSTMVKKLNKDNKYEVIHFDKPNNSFDFQNHYLEVLNKENVILDRYFFSEIVYSKVFNRKCRVSKQTILEIRKKLKNTPHCLIYLNPGVNELKKRYKLRGDELISENQIEKIVEEYDNLFFYRRY